METLKCSSNPSNSRLNSNYRNIHKFIPKAFGNKRSTRDFQCSHSVRGPFYQTIGHGTTVFLAKASYIFLQHRDRQLNWPHSTGEDHIYLITKRTDVEAISSRVLILLNLSERGMAVSLPSRDRQRRRLQTAKGKINVKYRTKESCSTYITVKKTKINTRIWIQEMKLWCIGWI